jgi:hypothetical protein
MLTEVDVVDPPLEVLAEAPVGAWTEQAVRRSVPAAIAEKGMRGSSLSFMGVPVRVRLRV